MENETKQLREEYGKLIDDSRAILEKAKAEKRELNTEESASYSKMETRLEAIEADIKAVEERTQRISKLEAREAFAKKPQPTAAAVAAAKTEKRDSKLSEEELRFWGPRATPEYHAEFRSWIASGTMGPVLQSKETRDLQATINTQGGYLVAPQQFVASLIQAVDNLVFMRGLATKYQVNNAESLGAPSLDTDVADPDWTAEVGTVSADTSLALGKRELHPHQLTKLVKVSMKLLRQAAINPENLVMERLAYKFAVTEENAFLNGNGAGQPLGVFTASAAGISTGRDVSTGNTSTAIQTDGLMEAFHTLKGQYWGTAQWIFHRDAVKQIRKLKDGDGQYIFSPGIVGGFPNTILGRPYSISEYAPNTFTTGLYVGIIGDFSKYWIADALNMEVQRLNELYAATSQVGFIGRSETDGMPVLEEAFVRVKLA
jgi:HK97 family phage major capsid protein